eukprot:c21408_g1_i1.p1 GENE.c21408_g1_i1~~c21408_g1_i1.p1  ORF type:complete len:120 (-),score=32.16 c21408_g1_i1:954-1313(-)
MNRKHSRYSSPYNVQNTFGSLAGTLPPLTVTTVPVAKPDSLKTIEKILAELNSDPRKNILEISDLLSENSISIDKSFQALETSLEEQQKNFQILQQKYEDNKKIRADHLKKVADLEQEQ